LLRWKFRSGTILNVLRPSSSSAVLVTGLGAVGLSAVWGAKAAGAKIIIAVDLVQERLDLALASGATHAFSGKDLELGKKIKEVTGGKGVNFALEATGVPAVVAMAWDSLAYHGKLAQVGTPGEGPTIPIEVREP
jgi:aryl-alcohol dehydrogenase